MLQLFNQTIKTFANERSEMKGIKMYISKGEYAHHPKSAADHCKKNYTGFSGLVITFTIKYYPWIMVRGPSIH